jgi:hypothetical protein
MKTFKTILCAVALTAAFLTSKADLVMTASGTAKIEKSYAQDGSKTATTSTLSFNNKFIYNIISNAVANAATWTGTNIAATNFPANGYIAFNPTGSDGIVKGVFYVTNQSGFFYPLSGLDTNGNYYSWIELDSQDDAYGFGAHGGFEFGWENQHLGGLVIDIQTGLASYHLNSQGIGTQTLTSVGLLYIHDDPYCYNGADNPDILFFNYSGQGDGDDIYGGNANAIEIHGILTATLATDDNDATISRISLTGSGNLIYRTTTIYTYTPYNLVQTATVNFAK